MATDKKVKIKLFESHFAWVNESLLKAFNSVVGNGRKRSEWIRIAAKEDFGVDLTSASDIPKLDMQVRLRFYEDKGEWLRERMRKEIKLAQKTKVK